LAFGRFRVGPNSTETKQFWTTREDAVRYARLLESRFGIAPSWVVVVMVEIDVASALPEYEMDNRLAKVVDERQLDWFNASVVELDLDA